VPLGNDVVDFADVHPAHEELEITSVSLLDK
jgi:hypothetical protein